MIQAKDIRDTRVIDRNGFALITTILPEHACANPPVPYNGNISCVELRDGVECLLTCNQGHGFAIPPADRYTCRYDDGIWGPSENMPLPDCSGIHPLTPERCGSNIKSVISEHMLRSSPWALLVKLLSGEYHRTPLMISQYWITKWLGAARQKAITWDYVK